MADGEDRPTSEPEDPALAIAARHALHDEELIAAFATDGEDADEVTRARTLIERCQACAGLHADLVAIGGALRAVASAETVAARRRAPRDFRLSVETANRVRPGFAVLRLRDRIRAALSSFGRPVGMSLASLGIVGLLLGTLTLGGGAGLAGAPLDNGAPAGGIDGSSAAPAATAGAQAATFEAGELTPVGSPEETLRMSLEAHVTASPASDGAPSAGRLASGGPTLSAFIVAGSAVLLVAGLTLFVLGRRRGEPIPGR